MEVKQKQLEARTAKVEKTVTTIKDTIVQRDNWRESVNTMINKIVDAMPDKDYQSVRTDTYHLLEERAGCDLSARLRNHKQRLADSGATKTKVNAATKMDVIEQDKRLREIYSGIAKELLIKHAT